MKLVSAAGSSGDSGDVPAQQPATPIACVGKRESERERERERAQSK